MSWNQIRRMSSAVVLLVSLCRMVTAEEQAAERLFKVTSHLNLEYRERERWDFVPLSNCLDVYAPEGATGAPTVMLVHGGAWVAGDKLLDMMPLVGRKLAQRGYVVVVPNYRLSPQVQHPKHIEDVARAAAWTKKNAQQYGGSADKLLLVGHSAGGHLVSLLATDARYLKQVWLSRDCICAVVSLSGVYHVSELSLNEVTGGWQIPLGIGTRLSPFALAFGTDEAAWKDASPANHIDENVPPFLLVSAQVDLPTLSDMSERFHEELTKAGVESKLVRMPCRGHATNFWRMAAGSDPTFQNVVTFLDTHSRRVTTSRVN